MADQEIDQNKGTAAERLDVYAMDACPLSGISC